MFTITVQSPNLMQCYNWCTCTRCLLMSVSTEELELHQECRGGGCLSGTWFGHVELWHVVGGGSWTLNALLCLLSLFRQRRVCIWQNRAAVLSLAFLRLALLAQIIPSKTQSSSTWQSAIIFHLFVQATSLWLQDQGKLERVVMQSTDLCCPILTVQSEIMNEWECIYWPMAWKKALGPMSRLICVSESGHS